MIDPAPAWEMMRSAPLIAAWMPVAFYRRPNEKNKTNEETERFSDETNLSEKESRWKESLWENAELSCSQRRRDTLKRRGLLAAAAGGGGGYSQ